MSLLSVIACDNVVGRLLKAMPIVKVSTLKGPITAIF